MFKPLNIVFIIGCISWWNGYCIKKSRVGNDRASKTPARVMKKLQHEVAEICQGKSMITEEDLEKMHYLRAVIKENFRLHIPPPLLVPRMATEDVKVMGYDIRPGIQVIVNAWAIGRDPTLWEEPEEFRPERFLKNPFSYKGVHFEWLPCSIWCWSTIMPWCSIWCSYHRACISKYRI
ncbi:putative cytochrome P450 [Helianthus annuus]|nr:putative cytochrome P450 [Helianthus annuus]